MSSSRRPAGTEDNILARLERDGKRGAAGKPWPHARLAWCTLASVLVIGLVGALASLAKENLDTRRPPTLIEARAADAASVYSQSGFAPLPPATPPVRMAAAIIDLPPERTMVKNDGPAQVPPLVMLKPADAIAKTAAKPVEAPVRASVTPPVRVAAPVRSTPPAKLATAPAPVRAIAPKLAAKATPARPAAPARTASAKPVRPIVAAAPPRAPVTVAARSKKPAPAAPARAEPSAVDSDIALLSAIIMHAPRHAGERVQQQEAAPCVGKKCPASGDPLAPKATD